MKRVLIFLLATIVNTNTFAYVNNKVGDELKVYCPDHVACETQGINIVCSVIGNNLQYWQITKNPWINPDGMPAGNYFFSQASEVDPRNSKSVKGKFCSYKYNGSYPFPVNDVIISLKDGAEFEPVYKDTSSYWVELYGNGKCSTYNPSFCPIIESNAIVISQLLADKNGEIVRNVLKPVDIAANHILFPHPSTVSYIKISYDEATRMCGSVKACTIYIRETKDGFSNYDSVTVDMTNNMKISQIIAHGRSESNVGYSLSKHEPFNMVMFSFLN